MDFTLEIIGFSFSGFFSSFGNSLFLSGWDSICSVDVFISFLLFVLSSVFVSVFFDLLYWSKFWFLFWFGFSFIISIFLAIVILYELTLVVWLFLGLLESVVLPSTLVTINESAFNNCSVLTIYCEIEEQPEGWHYLWNPEKAEVEWGYKG